MSKNLLMIGIPTYSGLFPTETVEALLKLKKTVPTMIQIVERQRIDKSRNYVIKQALESNCSHLLFIDDDNPPPEDTIEKFIQDDKDIVCAPIPTRNPSEQGIHELCIFKSKKIDEEVTIYEKINKIDQNRGYLFEIDGCGMGCTMIKRNVFEKLWNEYKGEPFAFGEIIYSNNKKRTTSEDVEFSERAKLSGFKIRCDTRISPIHIGQKKYIKFNDSYLI